MKKRSIIISGHPTSVSVEDEFWDIFCQIVKSKKISIAKQIEEIDKTRTGGLSSAIRIFVLEHMASNCTHFDEPCSKL